MSLGDWRMMAGAWRADRGFVAYLLFLCATVGALVIPGITSALSVTATVTGGAESIVVNPGDNYYVYWDIQGADSSTTCYEEYGNADGAVEGGYSIPTNGSYQGPTGRIGFYRFYCDSWSDRGTEHAEDTVYASEKVYLNANGQSTLTIAPGESYTLSWSSAHQKNVPCTMSYTYASGGGGSFAVTQNTSGSGGSGLVGSYTLTCTGSNGQPVSASVTINQTPTVVLNVNGQDNLQIAPGGSYTLYWDSANATSCTMSYEYASGDRGSGGSASKTVTIVNISCSVTVDQNPIAYAGSTILRWTSANAATMYLNNVGYVTPNTSGAATVGPLATTNYDGTAVGNSGQSVSCPRTLTVNPPANCSLPWGGTLAHGSSITAYQAATVPYGSSCVSQTRTCSNGTLSGSYAYGSCTVNPQPVSCSLSVNPTTITQGQSSTLSWTSSGATSCTGNNFSTGSGSPASGSTSVSPSSSTTYTASCTGAGGTTQCTGTGSGGAGASLTVSCTPAYTCTGAGNQTITYKNSSCQTSTVTTCVSPQFCSSGSATCLIPSVTGSISASPTMVNTGDTTEITWSTTNATSCTVSGNGDTWTGTSGTHTSSPITDYVTYTLVCDGADADSVQMDFQLDLIIFNLPNWFEV